MQQTEVIQRTDEWKDEKLGVVSGTRAYDLMSSNITRRTLLATLIVELLTASNPGEFYSAKLEAKGDMEPEAASYYAIMNDAAVTAQDAYIESDLHPMFACSPDGLVNDDGGVDFKRLDDHNHVKMLLGAPADKKYSMQCHWCMFITGRQWWDLFFYCETLPDSMRGFTIRIERDETMMKEMQEQAEKLLDDLRAFLRQHGLAGLLE